PIRITAASLISIARTNFTAEPPDVRQSQRSVSHHRRVDRGGRGARPQSLSSQERTRGRADQCRPRRAEDPEQVREAVLTLTKSASRCLVLPAGIALCLIATAAPAQVFSREQDIADLRIRQRDLGDGGSWQDGLH